MPQEPRCPTCDQTLPGAGAASGLPSSLVAAARREDASLVRLAVAYLTGALAVTTGVAPLFAGQLAIEWKVLAVLAGVLAGAVLFVSLKYASEGMRALADVARAAARVEEKLERQLPAVRQAAAPQGVPSRESGT
jgi:hypothetical protein